MELVHVVEQDLRVFEQVEQCACVHMHALHTLNNSMCSCLIFSFDGCKCYVCQINCVLS